MQISVQLFNLLAESGGVASVAQVADRLGENLIGELTEAIRMLDESSFLETARFRSDRSDIQDEYNSLNTRPPQFAGTAYPSEASELSDFVESILEDGRELKSDFTPQALFIPHIDPSLAKKAYGSAYESIRETDADTFVILGVPHRMSYDRIMPSRMDFDTPLGPLRTDRKFVEELEKRLSYDVTRNEIAHRVEHSIEFQTIFLRHVFRDREISIVPILVGSLYQYVESGEGGVELNNELSELYTLLGEIGTDLERKICWIASVDFCHVGLKFGDSFRAEDQLDRVKAHDRRLIEAAKSSDHALFIERLTNVRNEKRVCGVAPMYTLLRSANLSEGTLLEYDLWNETETGSAVSFASMAFK